jgi:hypothetical protein
LNVTKAVQIHPKTEETFTSLETLFYYPYKWLFKYQLGLRNTSILSVVKDVTLMGNLAHRLFEMLFNQKEVLSWDKKQVQNWIFRQTGFLLEREGAVLLMYGREPEKTAFINTLQYAAWALVSMIKSNGWTVLNTEKQIEGTFSDLNIKGKADLVLENTNGELAILDLKWRGGTRREKMIKSEEDLQLVMYAHLLTNDESIAHTAFFIIEEGKLIARNNEAFSEAVAVTPEGDARATSQKIWRRMVKTYQWRIKQLQNGAVEVRTKQTYPDLETPTNTTDGTDFNDFLEMRQEDAPFDDYKTLINLIE